MNERSVQGVAPNMLPTKPDGNPVSANAYFLSSSEYFGSFFQVTPYDTVNPLFKQSNNPSTAPWAPEGMYSTLSSGNLYMVTEGDDSTGTLQTNPKDGGRAVLITQQSTLN